MGKLKTNNEVRSDGQYISDQIKQDPYVPDIGPDTAEVPDADDGTLNVMFHHDMAGGALHDQEDTKVADPATGTPDSAPDALEGASENGIVVHRDAEDLGSRALDSSMGMVGDDADRWLATHDPDHTDE